MPTQCSVSHRRKYKYISTGTPKCCTVALGVVFQMWVCSEYSADSVACLTRVNTPRTAECQTSLWEPCPVGYLVPFPSAVMDEDADLVEQYITISVKGE